MSARTWNTEQLTQLYQGVQRAIARPVGPHLSKRIKKLYAKEDLTAEAIAECDRHLISCETCCRDVEDLLAESSLSRAAATAATSLVAKPVRAARKVGTRLKAALWKGLTEACQSILDSFPAPALVTGGDLFKDKTKTPGGTLSWRGQRMADGALLFKLASSAAALKGATIVLKQGRFECPIEVKSVGRNVGAVVVISKRDWQRLSSGPLLDRIVLRDGTVITADDFRR